MHADISRDTFAALRDRHFLRVLLQQGRPLVDAEFNEQVANLLHYMQTLAADLIGPYGGPKLTMGFGLIKTRDELKLSQDTQKRQPKLQALLDKGDFLLSAGHYYVDGVLCENNHIIGYSEQLAYDTLAEEHKYLLYLDVWERHISHWEDRRLDADPRSPSIREVALGDLDTTTRTRITWRVRAITVEDEPNQETDWADRSAWRSWLANKQIDLRPGDGRLRAQTDPRAAAGAPDPCIQPPDAGYRGAENLLCRVEIHRPGQGGQASYKVSFMNGSVVFPIRSIQGTSIVVGQVRHSDRNGLAVGDWVEILNDRHAFCAEPGRLCRVVHVDQETGEVTLDQAPGAANPLELHPILRCWDAITDGEGKTKQHIGEATVQTDRWLHIGYGVHIWFDKGMYQTGDYWLIPARAATGDIEWPRAEEGHAPLALPPQGVEHHYAPLALITLDDKGKISAFTEYRRAI